MGLILNQCTIINTIKAGAGNNLCQWEKNSILSFQQIVIEVVLEETRLLRLILPAFSGFKKNLACDGRLPIG